MPEYEKAIDTIEDVAKVASEDSHYILLKEETATHSMVINAKTTDGMYFIFKQHFQRTKQRMIEAQKDILQRVEDDPRNVVMSLKMNMLARRYLFARKSLHISEAMEPIYLAWALSKRSPLIRPFDLM